MLNNEKKPFKDQLEHSIPLSKERINGLFYKTFSSGKKIKENDVILFAYNLNESNDDNVDVDFIRLSPEEINDYEYNPDTIEKIIPTIIRKK